MNAFGILPPEAHDAFIRSLDPRELAEIIKANPPASARIFQGFRPGAQALQQAAVRQRVLREAERDALLREILHELWERDQEPLVDFLDSLTQQDILRCLPRMAQMFGGANVCLALALDGRKGLMKAAEKRAAELVCIQADPEAPRPVPSPSTTVGPKTDRTKKLSTDLKSAREKVSQLTKENRALEQQLRSAQRSVEGAAKDAARATSEAREAKRASAELSRKADHAISSREKAIHKAAEQERTVKELRRALDASRAEPEIAGKLPEPPWHAAVLDLLKAKNYKAATDFLVALAGHASTDARPHALLVQAYRGAGQPEAQKKELGWLGEHYLAAGHIGPAVDYVCRGLTFDRCDITLQSLLREAFARTDSRNEKRMSELRRTLQRLQRAQPEVYTQAIAIARLASRSLAQTLEEVPHESHIDKLFYLEANGTARHLSPRQMVEIIDLNKSQDVTFLREALGSIRSNAREQFAIILDAIRACDVSCCVTLTDDTTPVVVDASNVAYHFPTAGGKPRLRNIVEMRRELRRQGYFPVLVFADAALPYQIDQPSDLRRMVESGQVELAEAKTDADGIIIDAARRLDCPVVTRDAMLDWDPEGNVTKLRFDLDHDFVDIFD